MTKAVLEAGTEGAAQRTAAAIPSSTLAVPASLQASLMARLDRLGPAKEIAQIGAAIGREFSHALLAAVVHKPEAELGSALDRLIAAGLLFRQGVPPHATYLFKHALVQDAAYGTLLREPRRALHSRIAETLEGQFAEIAESRPELLARHCTEAGLIEKAAGLWGKAGQRSIERSALVEAVAQLSRALDQMATLPSTPLMRREQIKLQVALVNPLMHVKGYAAPETKAAAERARLLIEQAEALGEPPEDPLLLFSVLYGFWAANYVAFHGGTMRELAAQFLTLAEKQRATVPLMIGHRLMGNSLLFTGNIAESRAHYDQAIALYDPAEHRALVTRFGLQAGGVANLSFRSLALWLLGYPAAALADADHALKGAREIDQAATLMYARCYASWPHFWSGNYAAANTVLEGVVALAEEKGALFWKALGMIGRGSIFALTGKASNAVQMITSGIAAHRSMGSTVWMPLFLPYLARAYADLGQFDDAWRCIGEATSAIETTGERWCEAEVYRTAGEIAFRSLPDAAKAEGYFERALAVSRAQQAEAKAAADLAVSTVCPRVDFFKRKRKMKTLLSSMWVAALVVFSVSAASSTEMEFAQHSDGAMRVDGNSTWISAEGSIVAATPAVFERFLDNALIFKRQAVVINSPGGSVLAAIRLGELIRAHQLLMTVAKTETSGKSIMQGHISISSLAPGICASACVFAFAGGVERYLVDGSRVGVHQISVDYGGLYGTKAISVEDLDRSFASSQVAIGLAISHFLEMGIDPSIIPMMVTKAPSEIKWLSGAELASTKIIYDPKKFDDWTVGPYKAGLVAFTKSVDAARQLTLFCSGGRMKFKLSAGGGAYGMNFVAALGDVQEIEIAGIKVAKPNFKVFDVRDGMVINGDWFGTEVKPQDRSTFSLFGETTGSMADLFSMYGFNEHGFEQSLRLARKNCVS
jgi:hypothetical protein